MTKSTTPFLFAMLALGCGTNYLGDVPEDGSEDESGPAADVDDGHSGGNSGAEGEDGLSGNVLDEGGSSGGDEQCLPIEEVCGDEAQSLWGTTIDAYRTPDLGYDEDGSVSDACTIASSTYDDAAQRTVFELDCDGDVHWQLWLSPPEETLAHLSVGRELELAYAWEDFDYQRNLALFAGPDDPIFLAQNGRHVTPAAASYAPFTVEVLDGVCDPYCVPEDQCVSSELQTLRFGLGEESVDIWTGNSATLGDAREYTVLVDFAVDNPVVHPDAPGCEYTQSFAQYWFVIAETTAT
jgi:hypothetical protein